MKKTILSGILIASFVFLGVGVARAEQGQNTYSDVQIQNRAKMMQKANMGVGVDAIRQNEGVRKDAVRSEWNKEDAKERMHDVRKKWGERMEVGIKMHAENNLARFDAYYNRLVKIAERIDSRISKLKDEGEDVSVSVKHMSSARVDLSDAKNAIADLKAAWKDVVNTETDTSVDNSAFEKCMSATGGVILKTFPAKCQLEGQTYVDLSVSVKTEVAKDGRFEKLRSLAHTAKEELKSAHKHMVEAIRNIKPGQQDVDRPDTIKANTEASVDVSN